jgi:hypothetical protein
LLCLEIVQQHTSLLTFLTPIPYNYTTAVDDLSRVALSIKYAESSPFSQLFSVRYFDQGDLVFGAQCNDKFLVCFFLATFVQDAHMCLAAIKCFGGFAKTTGETIVNKSKFEDTCENVASDGA